MSEIEKLISELEGYAAEFGLSPATLGERVGQGGRFYARLKEGRRVWPETIEKVRDRMRQMQKAGGKRQPHLYLADGGKDKGNEVEYG